MNTLKITPFSSSGMKKATTNSSKIHDDDMLPEYDFRGAVRGKAYKPLHKGYSVTIHKEDGSTVVEYYKLIDGAIIRCDSININD